MYINFFVIEKVIAMEEDGGICVGTRADKQLTVTVRVRDTVCMCMCVCVCECKRQPLCEVNICVMAQKKHRKCT